MAKGNCGFCGGEFDNVFEAVDHLQDEFAPKFVVGPQVKLNLADLFYEFYTSGN